MWGSEISIQSSGLSVWSEDRSAIEDTLCVQALPLLCVIRKSQEYGPLLNRVYVCFGESVSKIEISLRVTLN